MRNFKNKVVWITGASSGIGEALAYAFAKQNAILVLSSRNAEKLGKVKKECLKYTLQCLIMPIDLSDVEQLENAVTKVVEETGRIDILINNAGRSQRSFAKDTPLENDRSIMEINFFSAVALTKLVLPHMIKQKSGHLVVISSISGKFGFPMRTAYCASKHAIQGYYEALRTELVDQNINVTIVSPGRIKTNISLNALIEDGSSYNKMDNGQAKGLPVGKCANQIIKAIRKRKKETLVGGKELLMVYIHRFLPALYYRIVTKIKN